jgi:hypothetical protein
VSALRIARPGHATELVDLGPACGRVSFTRGPVAPIGGLLVVAPSERTAKAEQSRRYRAQERIDRQDLSVEPEPKPRPLCGRWIILSRAACARAAKHAGSCTTAERLARLAERRRAS